MPVHRAANLDRTAGHRAWFFRARWRRVEGTLCQPQLRPGQPGRSRRGGREPRPGGGGAGAGRKAGHPGPDPQSQGACRGCGLGRRLHPEGDGMVTAAARPDPGHPDRRLRPGAVGRRQGGGDRRRPCRLERRALRRAGRRWSRPWKGWAPARAISPPPSAPASARTITKWAADFRAHFLAEDPRQCRFLRRRARPDHFRFDLPAMPPHRLARAGIGDIAHLGLCTYPPENGFFSFRRTTHRGEADYGREISAIVLTR